MYFNVQDSEIRGSGSTWFVEWILNSESGRKKKNEPENEQFRPGRKQGRVFPCLRKWSIWHQASIFSRNLCYIILGGLTMGNPLKGSPGSLMSQLACQIGDVFWGDSLTKPFDNVGWPAGNWREKVANNLFRTYSCMSQQIFELRTMHRASQRLRTLFKHLLRRRPLGGPNISKPKVWLDNFGRLGRMKWGNPKFKEKNIHTPFQSLVFQKSVKTTFDLHVRYNSMNFSFFAMRLLSFTKDSVIGRFFVMPKASQLFPDHDPIPACMIITRQ